MSKLHPLFEQALEPLLKPIPTRNGPAEPVDRTECAYGDWCRRPSACRGKGYCPLDPVCGD